MKGKGKKEKDSSDSEECPLQFLDFKPIDETRLCPRFTAVVQRSEEESVSFEDLDPLQLELEMLLVSVVKRQQQLNQEMEALINWHDVKHRDKKTPTKSLEITGKRSKPSEDKPNKKFKEGTSSSVGKSHSRSHKVKNLPIKFTEVEYCESPHEAVSKKIPVKNDIPNQFWQFIEPYCCPITSEHIKVLNEIIKSYDDDAEYYKVPNLGKHYSLKWEQDDVMDDRKTNSKHMNSDKKKGLSASNSASSSSVTHSKKSPKKGKNSTDPDKSSFGALTQRLVSCLIEENLITPGIIDSKSIENESIPKGSHGNGDVNIFKSLNLGNTAQLERRIRKELEEHGILSMDDILNVSHSSNSDDDEILQELKRNQSELKALSTKNQAHLKRLLNLAKKEISKQELNKKLQNADNEVTEAYRRIIIAKQKKRSPTKKEKEQAWKALKERENILKQLENNEKTCN